MLGPLSAARGNAPAVFQQPEATEHQCVALQEEQQPGLEGGRGPCLSHYGDCSTGVDKYARTCAAHGAPETAAVLKKGHREGCLSWRGALSLLSTQSAKPEA